MLKKICIILLIILPVPSLFAQKKVIFEKIRSLSFNKPIKDFLQDPAIIQTIAEDLNNTLLKQQQIPLVTTKPVTVEFIPYDTQVLNVAPFFTDADTSHLHLYLDIFEISPGAFFTRADNYPPDSELVKRAATILLIKATLFSHDTSVFLNEALNVIVSPAETPGIGYLRYENGIRYADLTVVPKVFTQLLKAATNMLFDPKNEIATVEIKVQPAFLSDNYLLPKTVNQPRIYVKNTKNISSYRYDGKTELIRMEEPVYEEIMIKGRKPQKYPDDLTNAIKLTPHFGSSDYVFLRQECRDVLRDKNYLLKLTVQVDHSNLPENQDQLLTNFLPGNFHFLFLENDTVAKFGIEKNIPANGSKVFPGIITTGYDTVSAYRLNGYSRSDEWDVIYDYAVKGTIGNQSFSIKCSGIRNKVKEFFLGNKLVCIAQGRFVPEKFVIFDASLSPELLNRLFMIGFNRFFE